MFKTILAASLVLLTQIPCIAQGDIQKMVDTEHALPQFAGEMGTRAAFLEYLAPDGLVFVPDRANGVAYWTARGESKGLLSWAPNYADISANGILGYTTGNWEYRANGKDDTPGSFGQFITLWLRQPGSKYKFVVDIGVGHAKPDRYSTDWVTSSYVKKDTSGPTRDAATDFYEMAAAKGLSKAYESFASENIRSYREEKLPILGKKDVVKLLKSDKAKVEFAKRSSTFTSDDISYNLNTYTKTRDGKAIEKGNFLQIWKFYDGRWHIVLDVFKPVP